MNSRIRNSLRAAIILASGIAISWLLLVSKPEPGFEHQQEPPPHLAEIVSVALKRHAITVSSQGSATPKTEIDLTSKIGGEVISVGEHFAAGGYFEAGEALISIDPRDYEITEVKAEANLAEARKALAQEQGHALQAKREWRDLGNQAANDLFLRKPQLAAASAMVKAAEADLEQARLNLERTTISLPFDGRVVNVVANLGQYINAGAMVGRVYAVDVMEVRLPVTAAELALLNLKTGKKVHDLKPLWVDLHFTAGHDVWKWRGKVVRLEATVDVKSRLFYLVADIDNQPIAATAEDETINALPILPGTFVEASIRSNPHDDVAILPRSALYQSDQVLVLDDESRLSLQQVTVLQVDSESLVVRGLRNGQRVLAEPPSFMELGAVYSPTPFISAGFAE